MIEEILQAFKKRIEGHTWIDTKTRKGVLDKVRSHQQDLFFTLHDKIEHLKNVDYG